MPELEHLSHKDMHRYYNACIREMHTHKYIPDVVVGVARGGLDFGVKLSHYFDCPFEMLSWQLRDGVVTDQEFAALTTILTKYNSDGQRILFADDICDSGETVASINEHALNMGIHIEFACAISNEASTAHSGTATIYEGRIINRTEEEQWFVFPWENWYDG